LTGEGEAAGREAGRERHRFREIRVTPTATGGDN